MAAGTALLILGLLVQSAAVADGVRKGLETCANVLIPSLFPFMVFSGLLSLTELGRILSIPLAPFTKRVLKLPGELGATVLLSLIGGYPVGAKSISTLLAQGKISKATAERMLCFCVNSGPSFLITAVGAGMFLAKRAGLILFATQTAATILIGIVVSRKARPEKLGQAGSPMRGAEAFVAAVTGAANAMIAMCAFAVLFSGLLSLVDASGIPAWIAGGLPVEDRTVQALISGLFEVTAGCLGASALGGAGGFAMASVFVSFSGLSVLFQIMSCFRETPIRFGPMVLSRLAHGLLSTAMALPLYRAFCMSNTLAVWASQSPPVMAGGRKAIVVSACLLGMCSILLATARPAPAKRKGRDCGASECEV